MIKLPHYLKLTLILTLLISSCIIIDGKWKDNIKLSTKSVVFEAHADSVIITTKGDWWWIGDVTVNDSTFYGFEGIQPYADTFKIEEYCFVIERRDKNTLFIRLDENPLAYNRIVTVGLQAGDYFDRIKITQKAN